MDQQQNSAGPSRTAFITAGIAGTVLIAAARPAVAAGEPGVAGIAEINALLHRPARHKQVIAAPRINGGAAVRFAGNSLDAFEHAFGEPAGSLHVAFVFYGSSVFYAANDDLWGRYHLFDVLDASGDPLPLLTHSPANPFLRAGGERSIEGLVRRGVTLFVCNNALHEAARGIAAVQKAAPEVVYADFRRNLIPGATVVPAGVAALVLAQEAAFTFLAA
jgi:intracellular sulfur oxidation DsrE/DsrF family protein